ncbi:MAG TPA: response regulator [Nitrososphaeraceae archaeon]|nr:response regulator [Nitrososphaeraceae archaeon]
MVNKKNNNKDYNNKILANRSKEHSNEDKDRRIAKLFIVDDDPDIAHVLKLGLLKNGFLVSAFTNPEEALQNFQSNSKDYCLMLSDIRMPEMSGIQLARKVKEINPDIKVVLMTSFEIRDNEFSKVFPSMHVDGFVQKPIGISDLTNKILSIIRETKRKID